jgi:hypothetical protein
MARAIRCNISVVTRFSISTMSLLAACSGSPAEPHTAQAPPAPLAPGPVPASSQPVTATSAAPVPPPSYRECGSGCKAFSNAEAAFDHVLAEQPRVLAIGEAHAQSAGPKLASSTKRFMDGLLTRLAPRATDLVIELWVANGSCGKVEQKVQKQQEAVTAPQAATNQNEFMELGHRAKALGIMPHALVPSCEQYKKIAGAGAGDIEEMLTMLKVVTARDVRALLTKRDPERLIVAYGGAMHNDLVPRPGREDFSFGPELAAATTGRYVELDLIIPEQIKDTETWRALPWYSRYSVEKSGSEAYLLSWAPHAYALIFPKTPEASP